jgi:hypothetical protein
MGNTKYVPLSPELGIRINQYIRAYTLWDKVRGCEYIRDYIHYNRYLSLRVQHIYTNSDGIKEHSKPYPWLTMDKKTGCIYQVQGHGHAPNKNVCTARLLDQRFRWLRSFLPPDYEDYFDVIKDCILEDKEDEAFNILEKILTDLALVL